MNLITPSDSLPFSSSRQPGSAISRVLTRAGYFQLKPSRVELDLLNSQAVEQWFVEHQPRLWSSAAKVGIQANHSYPADFLLENLKIQTNVIETAWRSGVRRCSFWVAAASTRSLPSSQPRRRPYWGVGAH